MIELCRLATHRHSTTIRAVRTTSTRIPAPSDLAHLSANLQLEPSRYPAVTTTAPHTTPEKAAIGRKRRGGISDRPAANGTKARPTATKRPASTVAMPHRA